MKVLVLAFSASVLAPASFALQSSHTVRVLSAQGVHALTSDWRRMPGHNQAWAEPELDDSDWEVVADTARLPFQPDSWARLHLRVDPSLRNQALGLYLELAGSADLYLNGELIARFGWLRDVPGPLAVHRYRRIRLPDEQDLVFAIRYRPQYIGGLAWLEPSVGFRLSLGDPVATANLASSVVRVTSGHQMAFVGAFLGQAILHFLLFVFYPRIRSNLWFSLSVLCSAVLVGLNFEGCCRRSRKSCFWLATSGVRCCS